MKQRVYFEHLSCSHCAMKIEEKLEKRKLFPEVAVSLDRKSTRLNYSH